MMGVESQFTETVQLLSDEVMDQKRDILRILPKQNTVLLSHVREGVKKNVFFGTLSQTSDPTHPAHFWDSLVYFAFWAV